MEFKLICYHMVDKGPRTDSLYELNMYEMAM